MGNSRSESPWAVETKQVSSVSVALVWTVFALGTISSPATSLRSVNRRETGARDSTRREKTRVARPATPPACDTSSFLRSPTACLVTFFLCRHRHPSQRFSMEQLYSETDSLPKDFSDVKALVFDLMGVSYPFNG